ncbi:MAG: META domain-containing protein [Helicobacteraceae bacterium]|nr:META domain-containing protein [Helicobacteraceae bacterium]
MKKFNINILLVLAIFMAGCGANAMIAKKVESKVYKINYIVLDNEELKAPESATLGFKNDRIYGNAGCNRYFAGIKWLDDKTLEISNAGSTKMLCHDEEANSFEYQYLLNLGDKFNIVYDEQTITLINDKISIVLDSTSATLEETE